jgi:hypothetical protein
VKYEPYPAGGAAGFEKYHGHGVPLETLESAAAHAGTPGRLLAFAGRHRLAPEPFLFGSAYVLAALHRYAFLNGEYSTSGWPQYFPYAFAVKTTLPMLALLAGGLALLAAGAVSRRRRAARRRLLARAYAATPVLALLAIYWPALVTSTINIGARHLLPVIPAACVLAGALGRIPARRPAWGVVALLLVWHVGEGVRAYPDYLAYFNQVVGRGNAWRHLVDSNLDWGQDLPGLRDYLERRLAAAPGRKAFLSYFGADSPSYRRIPAEPLELGERVAKGLPPIGGPGIYCVSATNLQAVYFPVRGRWSREAEQEYRELLARRAARRERPGSGPAAEERRLHDLGTSRLLAFLRQREPDDSVGYSILVYNLTEGDLRDAFDGPPPELVTGPGPRK